MVSLSSSLTHCLVSSCGSRERSIAGPTSLVTTVCQCAGTSLSPHHRRARGKQTSDACWLSRTTTRGWSPILRYDLWQYRKSCPDSYLVLLSLLSATPAGAIGPAQAGPVPCLDTSSTLKDLVDCIYPYLPRSYEADGRNGFDVPTAVETEGWRAVVNRMLGGECEEISSPRQYHTQHLPVFVQGGGRGTQRREHVPSNRGGTAGFLRQRPSTSLEPSRVG